jgi:hypothetical protein
MLKENDKKSSWLVSTMVIPFARFSLLSGCKARGKKLVQLSQVFIAGTVIAGGCGCTISGPITGLNYQIKPYEYGLEIKSDFLKINIGTQEDEILDKSGTEKK